MKKILDSGERICLFCGNPEEVHYEEYQRYHECNCKDAVETRKINAQIEELKIKLPQPKFRITTEQVLNSI